MLPPMKKLELYLAGFGKSAIISCLTLLYCFYSFSTFAAAPSWSNGYPKTLSGASSIDITVSLNQPGKVYYVVYSAAPYPQSAQAVKDDAQKAIAGNIVKNGVIPVGAANTDVTVYLTKLKDNSTYNTYFIAESNASELQTNGNIKSITSILPKRQTEQTYAGNMSAGAVIGYNIYFPEDYYKDPVCKNFPLLLFLHGNGEKTWPATQKGTLSKVRKYGPPLLIDQGTDFPFIVVTPQCPYADWDSDAGWSKPGMFVNEIIEQMKSKYNIDPSRIYITGLSMGGGGTYTYFQLNPDKVAAAIPIAGWNNASKACSAKDVPLWAFHNDKDPTVSSAGDIALIPLINACLPAPNLLARLILYSSSAHDSWTITYNNTGPGIAPDNIYDWLTRQVKGNASPETKGGNKTPTVYGGEDMMVGLPSNGITLNASACDKDGTIASYKWTIKSGPAATLAGTDTPNLVVSKLSEGKYVFKITVTDNGGRSTYDEVNVTASGVTSLEDEVGPGTSMVSPNPVKDIFDLSLSNVHSDNVTLTLMDVLGRTVYYGNKALPEGTHSITLNSSELQMSSGIYYMKIDADDVNNQMIKIIKE